MPSSTLPADASDTSATVELLTLGGPEYRRVSKAPTRPATADEIPVIDLDGMWFYNDDSGTADGAIAREAKTRVATAIRAAATGAGFFYVANHGIPDAVVAEAAAQAERFFAQPHDEKMRVFYKQQPHGNGYAPVHSGQINRTETKDAKEAFQFRYQAKYDPLHAGAGDDSLAPALSQGDDGIWDQTAHLAGFQAASLAWWRHCLRLSRGLVRLFALALDLSEDYFDAITTHPGSDGLYIRYPGTQTTAQAKKQRGQRGQQDSIDVGIGSHTDMQCFTLLWQDASGGLEVMLRRPGGDDGRADEYEYEWVGAAPRAGTLVVNIADFLQRLSNDRFRSTVHRVYNRQAAPRFSMPFFFGFNYDAECAVVPTCIDAAHPARYAPISCGKWRDERMALASVRARAT